MHRHKAGTTSRQDLTAQENTAQDSQVVKKRVPGTLEMAQAEPQKTPPPEPAFPAGCLFAQTHHASAVSRLESSESEYPASRPRGSSPSWFPSLRRRSDRYAAAH